MTLRHWPSAWTWLCTVLIESMLAPGSAIRANWMRRKCSAMMCSVVRGRKWWMSLTRPAMELSIGISPRSASPVSTAEKASSNDAHGSASISG